MSYRVEHDSLGELKVPQEALYGVQTLRAVQNFPISGIKPHKVFIESTVHIKKAAARFHAKVGMLDKKKADAIIKAADEILDKGKWIDQFVVDVYQAGAGTSHNMNTNEVLANRAIEILGGKRGDRSADGTGHRAQSHDDRSNPHIHGSLLRIGGSPY